jgi:hypothetical protein
MPFPKSRLMVASTRAVPLARKRLRMREHACSLRPSGTAVALGGSPMNVVTGTQFAEKLESAGVGIWNSGLNRSYFNAQPRRPPRPGDVRREPPVPLREEDQRRPLVRSPAAHT